MIDDFRIGLQVKENKANNYYIIGQRFYVMQPLIIYGVLIKYQLK